MSDNNDTDREQERLDDLQHKIDEVRESVNEDTELDEDERRFIDDGAASEDVDDTIAPG